MKVACQDVNSQSACTYVARGETMDELQADLTQHTKTIHSYTDEQLNDPKTVEAAKAAVKEE